MCVCRGYFTSLFVVFAEQGGRVPAKLAADGGTGTTGIRWRLTLLKRLQASQCGTASIADAPRVCALQTNGCGYAARVQNFFGLSTKKFLVPSSGALYRYLLSGINNAAKGLFSTRVRTHISGRQLLGSAVLGCHALNPSRASGRCCLRCCHGVSAARAAARPLSLRARWLTWTTWSLRARPRQFAV